MSSWLRLKDIELLQDQNVNPDLLLTLTISPYDIPEAVRGFIKDHGKLRIEFRYIDGEESTRTRRFNEHLVLYEGEHSGRLLAMEVDLDSAGATSCGLAIEAEPIDDTIDYRENIESAWDRITSGTDIDSEKQKINAIARRAFETRQDDLLNQLVTH